MAGKSYIKTGTYNWSKIKKMYIKTGATTWTAIRKAYIKTGTYTWKKIFDTSSNRPFIENNDYPKIRLNTYRSTSTSGVQPPVDAAPVQFIGPRSSGSKGSATPSPSSGFVGGDGIGSYLWGYDGDWFPNTGVTFTYDWFWANTANANDATAPYTPASASGAADKISNVNANLGWLVDNEPNGVWLYFRVNASNASGTARAISSPVRLIRQEPTASTWSMLSPSSSSLNTPKFVSTSISNEWYDAPHFEESKVEWFSESSNTSPLLNSSTLVKTETLASFATSRTEIDGTTITQQPSYTPVNVNSLGYSDSDKYIYAKLTLINSYTKYENNPLTYITKTSVPVGQVRTITPNWGDYISVSTNGYIGIGSVSGMSAIQDTSTTGHVASILSKDLDQIHLKYYSDSSKYIVDFAGKAHGDSGTSITYRYQAWFYPGQNYVDFHVITNAGGTSSNAYLYNGEQQVAWGASKPTGTAYRVTLTSGVAYQNIVYGPRSTATGFTSITTNDGSDDSFTSLQLIQGVSAPENIQRPIFQLLYGNENKVGATYRLPSGSWSNNPTEYYYLLSLNNPAGTEIANSGWTTATYFDYTFSNTTSNSVAGMVYARNSGGEGYAATSTTSIGPFTNNLVPPTPTGVSFNGTSFTITSTGGSGPYYQLWYERGEPSTYPTVDTGYDSSGLLSTSISFTPSFTPAAGEVWNFWLRSATSATASNAGVDKGAYSSNYVSVTIPGPQPFTVSIYDSTVTPNTPSVSVSQTSGYLNQNWDDDANATGGWFSYISGGSQGYRSNTRNVSNDFWSVTSGSFYSGGVYAINTNKQVTISWGNVAGAQSYRIAYDVGGGTTQVVDKGSATSHTITTSQAVRVLGAVAYSGSNYDGVSRAGSYDALLFVTATDKTSSTGTWSATYTPVTTYGACDTADRTVYGTSYDECSQLQTRTCTPYTTYYKRLIYSDGVSTGTYDTSGCTTTGTGTSCTSYAFVNGSCGYTLTCTASCGTWGSWGAYGSYSAYSACYSTGSTGQKYRYRTRYRYRTCTATDCSTYTDVGSEDQYQYTACTVTMWQCTNYDVTNSASTNYYNCYTVGACTAPRDPSAGRTSCAFA